MRTTTLLLLPLLITTSVSADLMTRYSFDQDANDLAGTRHGQLKGTAAIADHQLVLDGEGWAEFPGGSVTALLNATVEVWFTYQRNGSWTRVFDFGTTNDQGLGAFCWYFTPDCPAGARTTFSNTDPGYTYEETIDTNTLPENVMTHVAVVYDGKAQTARLYLNGRLIGQRAMTVKLADIGRQHLYLGKSSYNSDKLLKAKITEFRVYDTALNQEEIAQHDKLGPDLLK